MQLPYIVFMITNTLLRHFDLFMFICESISTAVNTTYSTMQYESSHGNKVGHILCIVLYLIKPGSLAEQ